MALLIPFAVMVLNGRRPLYLIAVIVWIVAAASDVVDGYVARTFGQVTELGAVLDLIADRLMIACGAILLLALKSANVYLVLAIVAREMVVESVRALRFKKGRLLPHNAFGQAKMVAIVLAVVSGLAGLSGLISNARGITDTLLMVAFVAGTLSLLRVLDLW
jgi:CDP-diacylglycerol--glycerol-3-phosphate 3-phosphatidyltransferase